MASPSSPDDDTHSVANSTSSPHSLPAWHFPFGPSSKYHQRERPKRPAQHTRNNSSHFTPRGPKLATETRSHHRRALTNLPSPPSTASDYSQSPLGRFTNDASPMAHSLALPSTPAKSRRRNSSILHDSPFSDYFTDPDTHSLGPADGTHRPSLPASTSTATQQLLVRMNKLQSHLIRDSSSSSPPSAPSNHASATDDAISIVGRHLTSLERELADLSSQSRYAPELTDSGLFLHADDYPHHHHPALSSNASTTSSSSSSSSSPPDDPSHTLPHLRAERDYFLLETQRLLSGLRAAQSQLRARYEEVRDSHARREAEIEGLERGNAGLRAENAGLRADLAGDAGELLGLRLVLKGFEGRLERGEFADGRAVEGLGREMGMWRVDFREGEGRRERRRGRGEGEEVKGEWGIEVRRMQGGEVGSVTVRRIKEGGEEGEMDGWRGGEGGGVKGGLVFVEQGTQTEEVVVVTPTLPVLPSLPVLDVDEADDVVLGDECAITTSSEPASSDDESEGSEETARGEDHVVEAPVETKTPWQELWDGLAKLAGMDESRFDS